MKQVTRRSFTKAAAVTGLSALSASRVYGANEKIGLGFIGCGNRGDELLDAFLQNEACQPVAFCDLYDNYYKAAKEKSSGLINTTKEYKELIALKDVDAVVIATPDHWHALQMIEACDAKKHVYIEKPLSLTVAEGRAMVNAANRSKTVVQVGLHRRSSGLFRDAAEAIKRGEIGKVTMCRAFHVQNEFPLGIGKPSDTSSDKIDWEAWLGPAPKKPFNPNRTFYRFRWFYDYSGGQVANNGVHFLDFIHWATGQESPKSVAALGGKFAIEDNREIPDTCEVVWHYPNDMLVSFTQINANGAACTPDLGAELEIRGTKGTLYLHNRHYFIRGEYNMESQYPVLSPLNRDAMKKYRESAKAQRESIQRKPEKPVNHTKLHTDNFIKCILDSKSQPNSSIEAGHRATSAAALGRIALAKHAVLDWDGKAEQFTNNSDANKMLRYDYREPYKFPS